MKSETAKGAYSVSVPAEIAPFPSPSLRDRGTQLALGVLYDIKPPRLKQVPAMAARWLDYRRASAEKRAVPPLTNTPLGKDGFLGFSDNMRVNTLRQAYAQGAFPMTHFGPVRWYRPETRAVLKISDFKPRSELKRKLRKQLFRVTFDEAPVEVMKACAEPRPGQWPLTWMTPDVMDAYLALHSAGSMHSIEVWDENGELGGGLFGTCIGPVFVVESLFHRVSNTSKYGLAVLMAHLQAWGFQYVDYKMMNPHVASLGFSPMSLPDYLSVIKKNAETTAPKTPWQFDATLDLGTWKPAEGPPRRRTEMS